MKYRSLNEREQKITYYYLTEALEAAYFKITGIPASQDMEDFRLYVDYLVTNQWAEFNDYIKKQFAVSIRKLPIKPHKFKKCANCTRVFYDNSRNGRRTVCRLPPLNNQPLPTGKKSACEIEWHAKKEKERYINKTD